MSSTDIESPPPAGGDARAAGEANNVPAAGDSKVPRVNINIIDLLLQLYLLNALALALSFTIGGSPLLHTIAAQTLLSALFVIIIRAARLDGMGAPYMYEYKKRRWKCLVIYCWVLLVLAVAYDLFYYLGNVPLDRRAEAWVLRCYGACIAGMVLTVIRLSVALLCRMPLTSIGSTYTYYCHSAAIA